MHLTTKAQIIGWSVPRKLFEIPNEMRLVVVAGLMGNQGPIDGLGRINTVQGVSKAVEACQLFWSAANHLIELCDQVFLAHTDTVTEIPDRKYTMIPNNF